VAVAQLMVLVELLEQVVLEVVVRVQIIQALVLLELPI
tara:strand:- start:160 stop:273 length:114 start_codon:yes stop_codon:yes gene_type:complete